MRTLPLPAILLLAACGGEPERGGPASDPAPQPERSAQPQRGRDFELPEGVGLALARAAEPGWRLRRLEHAPPHFEPTAWLDAGTIFGLAGSNLVELQVDAAEYHAWNRTAWGAYPAPDGRRVAWLDSAGIRVGTRGREPRLLLGREGALPPEAGDLTGPLHWSPDGERLLAVWTSEAVPVHAIVEVASGRVTRIPERGDGYFLVEAFGWLDDERILFSAPPHLGGDGSPPPRVDLVVFEVSTAEQNRLTRVADGIVLRPLARWGTEGVLVAETTPGSHQPRGFSVRGTREPYREVLEITAPGQEVALRDTTALVLLHRLRESDRFLVWLHEDGPTQPLAIGRGVNPWAAWSPDGRRLAITGGEGGDGVWVVERR